MLRGAQQSVKKRVNSFNAPQKKKSPPSKNLKFVHQMILWGLGVSVIIAAIGGIAYMAYSFYLKTNIPQKNLFSACPNSFIELKTKPQYGIVFEVIDESVVKILLTAPETQTLINAIEIDGTDWFVVYFSKNFTFTQVSEFLRLSKLEKGNIDYCYLIEQLSLTSGIPLEYVMVRSQEKLLASTMSIADSETVSAAISRGKTKKFKQSLLPQYRLDDGTSVSVVTYTAFQEQFPSFFKIDNVSSEQAFVEVYNATTIDGYASIIARKWSMLGIDISRINNATYPEITDDVAVIYIKDADQYVRTMAIIKSSLPPGKVSIKVGRPPFMVTTGDIVVFLLKR